MKYYAHSLEGQPPNDWQPLEEHLRSVARLAAEFARPFGGEDWAYLAGLWHDLGKYAQAFQDMLFLANGIDSHIETRPGRVVHSVAGGHLASLKKWSGADRILSWLIMGHHGGLADYNSDKTGATALEVKMRDPEESRSVLERASPGLVDCPKPSQRIPNGADPAFYLRMLFSCLVDADFLDTEKFMDRRRFELRVSEKVELRDLVAPFDAYMEDLCSNARPTDVNHMRAEVLAQCCEAGEAAGVFSLTVPTGGGKTLASLAFALHHAEHVNRRRIIYVIPYTSIIEQTAEAFRKIPGFQNAVVEHHSNVTDDDESRESTRARLAAENWDAPIIVTTSVQFFESLHACRTSRCRKLHNLVNSVVILDEAQCLPPALLRPCVHALRELHRHYGVTPVLCTATQPVLTQTRSFDFELKEGFDSVTEIVRDPEDLAKRLRRTDVRLHGGCFEPVSIEELAQAICDEGASTLCIVNRKEECRQLARLLPPEEAFHLSTNMCAEHRLRVLAAIRGRLDSGMRTSVVSTSLIEAGVDIDFPVVYRALAGIDSLAQAAGRCNREGSLPGVGKVVVFVLPDPPDYIRQSADIARVSFSEDGTLDINQPDLFRRFFEQKFWQLGQDRLDMKKIRDLLGGNGMEYYFRTAAKEFRMIEDDWQAPAIVPYGASAELVDHLVRDFGDARRTFRRLQRFTIQIESRLHRRLVDEDYLHPVAGFPGVSVLSDLLYHKDFGFLPPDEAAGLRGGYYSD